jgi:hypothetical protein
MVTINSGGLPAHLQGKARTNNLFAAAVQVGGFPVISIKGKVFHIQRGFRYGVLHKLQIFARLPFACQPQLLESGPNKLGLSLFERLRFLASAWASADRGALPPSFKGGSSASSFVSPFFSVSVKVPKPSPADFLPVRKS